MKTDFYTKAVLTVIALVLIGILLKPVLTPSAVEAKDRVKFEHVQSSVGLVISFFDTQTGNLWIYHREKGQDKISGFKLVELGKHLQEIKLP
jgi:hypothetical protein